MFQMPEYHEPDFTEKKFTEAPDAVLETVSIKGDAPENYHSTSMLHTIATGNMTPSYRVLEDGTVRPVFLYTVDADEFVVNKLLDRGSLAATTIVTNVQDFIMIVAKGLGIL